MMALLKLNVNKNIWENRAWIPDIVTEQFHAICQLLPTLRNTCCIEMMKMMKNLPFKQPPISQNILLRETVHFLLCLPAFFEHSCLLHTYFIYYIIFIYLHLNGKYIIMKIVHLVISFYLKEDLSKPSFLKYTTVNITFFYHWFIFFLTYNCLY